MREMKYWQFIIAVELFLVGCGGSETDRSIDVTSPTIVDPAADNDAEVDDGNTPPEVILLGDSVVILSSGESYVEPGAEAFDDEDGELSSELAFVGSVDTDVVADYLLRYQVVDSAGKAGEAIRLVRVYDSEPVKQTSRNASDTPAELGYLEHLPEDYNSGDNYSAPLIIFNHGSGATGTGNLESVECCGLPAVINYDSWDTSLPFVVLSPQRVSGLDTQDLDDFIEYALQHYHVDPKRLYIAGWSQGANISLRYMVLYPDKIAAVVPVAGGWFQGVPSNVCDAEDIPMWSFVGSLDTSLITNTGIAAANAINSCNPSTPAKLTNYVEGTHFSTSLWPFIPSEYHEITGNSDSVEPDLFEWLLSHSQ